MRLRGRSLMAFALAPEPPIADWLAELDSWMLSSAGFFVGRPVILDLTGVILTGNAVQHLVTELAARGIRIMGIEGADPERLGPGLPPLVTGGRPAPVEGRYDRSPPRPAAVAAPPEPTSLLIDQPVRSGQSVYCPGGDVTVLGSVSSGAEIVAAGSIHVYGTLRGRAMAGTSGNRSARIFCSKIEAELLAIDGYYRTAEDLDDKLRNRPVQAWLDGDTLMIAALD